MVVFAIKKRLLLGIVSIFLVLLFAACAVRVPPPPPTPEQPSLQFIEFYSPL
jgi:hypothetical protein